MTLQQLRILREIARQSHNLSSAAAALHTSQPGVSRQVQLLERELGVALLARRKNRITGLTEPSVARSPGGFLRKKCPAELVLDRRRRCASRAGGTACRWIH